MVRRELLALVLCYVVIGAYRVAETFKPVEAALGAVGLPVGFVRHGRANTHRIPRLLLSNLAAPGVTFPPIPATTSRLDRPDVHYRRLLGSSERRSVLDDVELARLLEGASRALEGASRLAARDRERENSR